MPPWAKGIRLIAYLAAACQAAGAAATTGTAPTAGPPAASPRPERAAASNATNPADVAALQALRASLTGLPMDWYASSDPCVIPWTGVVCNGTRVVGVNLTSTPQQPLAVAGRLSPGLAGASDLQFVELSNNKITGTLPPQWGALSRLALLALNNNALDGPLPANWSGLTGAKYIGVNSNQLSGQLPASWGALSGLQLLDVSTNGLGPDLPAEWGGMTSLQKLNLEGNAFVGPLPSAWRGMISLQLLSVRGMCGVCGGDPFSQIVVILVQGSSLGWQCSSSNCYSVPLGFIGQAAIIAAIILVLATLCIWRRVYVHRRRRLGMRVSRRRSSGGIGRESGNELPEEVAPPPPPVVVLQPDGEQICTARMDAEWAAALAAAQHAEQGDKPAGQPPEEPQGAGTQTAAGPAAASPVSQRAAWWTRLQRRRQATSEQAQQGGASDRPAPASVELPPAAPLQQALSPVVSGSIAASSSTDLQAEDQSQHAQQPGHGISRRHSADSSAAAAGSAFGPLRRASTEGQQGAEQAAAAPWGDRPRQRTSGSRRRPVPFYDIDLGQLPGEPSAGAGAAAHADRASGYGS